MHLSLSSINLALFLAIKILFQIQDNLFRWFIYKLLQYNLTTHSQSISQALYTISDLNNI